MALAITQTASAQFGDLLRRARDKVDEARDTLEQATELKEDVSAMLGGESPAEEATRMAQECQAQTAADPRFGPCVAMCTTAARTLEQSSSDPAAQTLLDRCTATHTTAFQPPAAAPATATASTAAESPPVRERAQASSSNTASVESSARERALVTRGSATDAPQRGRAAIAETSSTPVSVQPSQPARSTAPELPAQFAGYRAGWLVSQIYDLQPDVLNPSDYRLSLYFNAYIRAFDRLCQEYLPADHVLYEPTYMAYDHTEYGLAFNTHVYKETVAESTRMRKEYLPIYADAKQGWMRKVIDMDEADDIKTFVDVMPFLMPGAILWNDATDAKEDAERVLTVERCDSAFTQRFERNLFRAIVDPPKRAPGTIQTSAGVGGVGTTLSHRNVEKGFVPPIPEPLPALPLTISIDTPPPGNHLVRVQLLNAGVAPFDPRMTADRLPAAERENMQADFAQAHQEGQLVLTCRYATPDGLTRTFAYWYETLAPVVADEARLRSRASDHPMLRVRETRSVCAGTQP